MNDATVKVKRLTKQDILAADDRKRVEVAVPEWGGAVLLRELSAGQRNDLAHTYQDTKGGDAATQSRALTEAILVASMVDDKDQPLFTADDLPGLRERSGIALDRVAVAALELNGMKAGAATEKEKNS